VVGGRQPAGVGTLLARDFVRDHEKRSKPVHELRRERGDSLRIVDVAPPCNVDPKAGIRIHLMDIKNAAGALLIILPLAFNLFFFVLGRRFDYPNILRSPTEEI
jgi:hypothetical protein